MNKILKAAILGTAILASIPAQAATVTDTFDVIVNLTPACRISAAPGDITVNYTAFTVAASTGTTNFTVQCSNNLLYSVTMPVVADNILANLGLTNSVAITAGGSTNVAGSAAGIAHTITATVDGNQAGTCVGPAATPCQATNTYTLTITF
jgi:hypothetical protein